MDVLIGPALGLGGMVLACIFIGPIREWIARRRTRRIARGKAVSFAARVSVDGGRLRHARLVRNGDVLRLRTWRGGFEIAVTRRAVVTRLRDDSSDPMAEWWLERHTDPGKQVVEIGTMTEDRRALSALRAAPSARPPKTSGVALVVASALLLGAALLTALYVFSYDATATVRDVNDDASSCLVDWHRGSRTLATHVDCGSYDAAGVGMTLPIVAQPEPFADQAFSGERSEIFQIDGVIVVVILLTLGVGVWRARGPRHPVPLTPVLVDGAWSHGSVPPSTAAVDSPDMTVIELAERVAGLQGWPRRWEAIRGSTPSPGRDVVGALTNIGWWTPVLILAAMTAVDPMGLGRVLAVVTALGVIVQCVRAFRMWTDLHGLWSRPLGSEWDCVGIPAPDGYAVLLCQGRTPHWLVAVSTMPPMSGRLRVRGELADRLVHLVPMTGHRVLLGTAERYTDEVDGDVSDYLHALLDEQEADASTG